jgi:hypothetical protein
MARDPLNTSLTPEQVIQRRLADLEDKTYPVTVRKAGFGSIVVGTSPSELLSPGFSGNWANFEAAGTVQTCKYRKSGDGRVILRGTVKRTAGGGNNIFTLPAGYRPTKQEIFICQGVGGAIRVDVSAAGVVSAPNISEAGEYNYLSLSTVAFYTD